jgi:methyl-accepting chemotaxis protein
MNVMSSYFGRLYHTVIGRILLFVALPMVLIFALTIAVASSTTFRMSREAAEEQLQTDVDLAAKTIDARNVEAVLTVRRMAEAQAAGMFGDREASLDFARRVLENSPNFTGCYFGYEPNADGKDAESIGKLPAECMDTEGRFIPYWFVAPGRGRSIQLEQLVDADTSMYYRDVKLQFAKTRKPEYMVTEPYVYQGKMIVEQTYPIVIDGQFQGIAGVDFALADVEASLRRMAKKEKVEAFLISSRGSFIGATTDPELDAPDDGGESLKTRSVAATEYADLFGELLQSKKRTLPVLAVDPIDGESYYYAASHVATGDWTLVVRESDRKVLAPIWRELAVRATLAVSALGVILTLLLTMTFRLGRRVSEARRAAERIAQGDLTATIEGDNASDETGNLLGSIRKMTENLNTLVGNVKRASIQLNSTATELAATSRQQESSASSFGAASTQIAAAARQISATSGELVDTMQDVTEVASGTRELATAGAASLGEMETTMQGLEQATASIGDKLAVINEKASNITGIVTTITKVADQTNLLSVNAAIEAEKAGEYGVGFLVVAREIRRLADQTASATLDIEQMVQQMHSAVSAGVMEMDRFTDHVRRSATDVVEISHQMEDIIERVNGNTARFERVHESMQSQSQGAQQISDAMASLTENATQTAEAVVEYSRAAAELREAIGCLQSSVASFQLRS